jgi:hypothetical protein
MATVTTRTIVSVAGNLRTLALLGPVSVDDFPADPALEDGSGQGLEVVSE